VRFIFGSQVAVSSTLSAGFPYGSRVRLARGELAVEAHHAARRGACDLPQRPPATGPALAARHAVSLGGVPLYRYPHMCSCWTCHVGP
jgi:hypothetical protein